MFDIYLNLEHILFSIDMRLQGACFYRSLELLEGLKVCDAQFFSLTIYKDSKYIMFSV